MSPQRPSALLSVLLLGLGAGCGGEAQAVIEPPFPVVDLNGTWVVTALQSFDSPTPPADPGTGAEPFRPVFVGMELDIAGDQLRDRSGAPLFEAFDPVVPNARWFNLAAGSLVVFDFANVGGVGCARREEISASFDLVGPDRLQGSLSVLSTGTCTAPAPLPVDATGQFTLVLERVIQPAVQAR